VLPRRRPSDHRLGLVGRIATVAALAAIALTASASPASAHALLLSSDPAAGAIVATAPPAISLHFSETVSIPFGALQLIDPNGRSVATGAAHQGATGRDLVLGVPSLARGSYDLAWQVLASDGHLTSGDFIFHVGAPSGNPLRAAHPVARNSLLGPLLGMCRFMWMMAFMFLVGASVLRRFVWTPAVGAAGAVESPLTETFRRRFGPALRVSWIVLVAAGGAALLLEAATVSRGGFWSSLRLSVLGRLLLTTTYGHLWLAQMTLALLMALPVYALTGRSLLPGVSARTWLEVGTVLAGGLAVTAAVSGHASGANRPVLTTAFVAVHLLSAAVWVGGLATVVMLALPGWRHVPDTSQAWKLKSVLLREVLRRFSRVALVSAPVLVVSGVVAAAGDLGHPGNLWRVAYGQVILVKVALLVGALGFGAWHFLQTPRRLEGIHAQGAVGAFERTSLAEVILLVAAIGAAAVLVGLVPGRALDLTTAAAISQRHSAGTYAADLYIAAPGVGPNKIRVNFTSTQGLVAGEVNSVTASLRGPNSATEPLNLQPDTPGHFSGVGTFPAPGRYQLAVSDPQGGTTDFDFRVADFRATD
jgi:copper transport protein